MKRSRVSASLLALVATLAVAANVSATPSTPVTITVEVTIGGSDNPFVATGGMVCDAGVVSNLGGNFVGGFSNTHAQIQLFQRFACDDGTFDLHVRVALSFTTFETAGTWSVVDGTGAYDMLRGTGTITGEPRGIGMGLDTFVGSMHFN